MDYHKDKKLWERNYSHQNQVFTLNGSGRAGKTTIANLLEKRGVGKRVLPYLLRNRFEETLYRPLNRSDTDRNKEIFGIAGMGWIAAEFHWRVKPLLENGEIVIFDHYLFDFIVDVLPDLTDIETFTQFTQEAGLPQIKRGNHLWLDISYETYLSRKNRFNDSTKELQTVPENLFEERRERYQTLNDLGLLSRIDAELAIEDTYERILQFFPSEYRNLKENILERHENSLHR